MKNSPVWVVALLVSAFVAAPGAYAEYADFEFLQAPRDRIPARVRRSEPTELRAYHKPSQAIHAKDYRDKLGRLDVLQVARNVAFDLTSIDTVQKRRTEWGFHPAPFFAGSTIALGAASFTVLVSILGNTIDPGASAQAAKAAIVGYACFTAGVGLATTGIVSRRIIFGIQNGDEFLPLRSVKGLALWETGKVIDQVREILIDRMVRYGFDELSTAPNSVAARRMAALLHREFLAATPLGARIPLNGQREDYWHAWDRKLVLFALLADEGSFRSLAQKLNTLANAQATYDLVHCALSNQTAPVLEGALGGISAGNVEYATSQIQRFRADHFLDELVGGGERIQMLLNAMDELNQEVDTKKMQDEVESLLSGLVHPSDRCTREIASLEELTSR